RMRSIVRTVIGSDAHLAERSGLVSARPAGAGRRRSAPMVGDVHHVAAREGIDAAAEVAVDRILLPASGTPDALAGRPGTNELRAAVLRLCVRERQRGRAASVAGHELRVTDASSGRWTAIGARFAPDSTSHRKQCPADDRIADRTRYAGESS